MTFYLIDVSFWRSLALRELVPMTLPVQKPCRLSWHLIDYVRQWIRIPVTIFHRTFTSTIPQKSPWPFRINTTVFQAKFL